MAAVDVERIGLECDLLGVAFQFEFVRYPGQLLSRLLLHLIAILERMRVSSNRFLDKIRIHA